MNAGFYAQLHLHTAESSRCGVDGAADMIRACADAGYRLVVVTDHFFNANINCPDNIPWPKKIDCLLAGYRAGREIGEKLGVTVLPGWETMTDGDGPEVLTYGLDERFLLEHPDVAQWPLEAYLSITNAAGAFNVHAHPFRQASYITPFRPQPRLFEAFEIYNAHNRDPAWNDAARAMAERYGLIALAGSDAHTADRVRFGAVELPYPVSDSAGLIRALRSRETKIVTELAP